MFGWHHSVPTDSLKMQDFKFVKDAGLFILRMAPFGAMLIR